MTPSKPLICSHVIYLGLTLYPGVFFWMDRLGILDSSSADLLALDGLSTLGGIVWWCVWLLTSWGVLRYLRKFKTEHVLAVVFALGCVLLGASKFRTLTIRTDTPIGLDVTRFLFCILPGLRGSLCGVALTGEQLSARHRVLGFVVVLVATIHGATYLWWPTEMVSSIGWLLGGRWYPQSWSVSDLIAQLAIASFLALSSISLLTMTLISCYRAKVEGTPCVPSMNRLE